VIPEDRKLYLALLAPRLLVLLVFIAAPITLDHFQSFHRMIPGLPQLKSPFNGHIIKACDVRNLHWKK
jgi:hypothetical protein